MQPCSPALPLLRIFTVRDIYYHRLQSCPVEAVDLFGVRPEEAGLSSRCVIDGIKCLVSAEDLRQQRFVFPEGDR